MEFLRRLSAQTLLHIARDLVGIDEMAVHALSHITGCHTVESVGIDQRIALLDLSAIGKSGIAQLLIIIVFGCNLGEVPTCHTVHEHRDAPTFTGLTHIFREVVVEGRTWFGVTGGLRFLVVMTKLDDNVVTRFQL